MLPGHFWIVKNDKIDLSQYYDLKSLIHVEKTDEVENCNKFKELFFDSVKIRLRSDVPIGTCLSGGLDSSAILSVISQSLANGESINTFSSIFKGEPIDESRYIETMVEYTQAKANFTSPKPDELLTDLEQLIRCQDEPFWSTTTYNHWRVMKLAKESGVKVLLDGQGGDELLAGYTHYYFEFLLYLFKKGKFNKLIQELTALHATSGNSRIKLFANSIALALPSEVRFFLQKKLRFAEKAVISDEVLSKNDGFYKTYNSICSDRILNRGYYDFFLLHSSFIKIRRSK